MRVFFNDAKHWPPPLQNHFQNPLPILLLPASNRLLWSCSWCIFQTSELYIEEKCRDLSSRTTLRVSSLRHNHQSYVVDTGSPRKQQEWLKEIDTIVQMSQMVRQVVTCVQHVSWTCKMLRLGQLVLYLHHPLPSGRRVDTLCLGSLTQDLNLLKHMHVKASIASAWLLAKNDWSCLHQNEGNGCFMPTLFSLWMVGLVDGGGWALG